MLSTPPSPSENTDHPTACPNCNTRLGRDKLDKDSNSQSEEKGFPRAVLIGIAVLCGLYLIYPSMGIFELIPDMIPIVGSLDEAGATAGLLYAASQLGWLNIFHKS